MTATVTKEDADKKLGISIRRTSVSGTTLVGRISGDGPFAGTGLQEGMKIVSIKAGDKDCTDMELEEMLGELRSATGAVTIEAEQYTPVAQPKTGPQAASTGYKPLPPPEGSGHRYDATLHRRLLNSQIFLIFASASIVSYSRKPSSRSEWARRSSLSRSTAKVLTSR